MSDQQTVPPPIFVEYSTFLLATGRITGTLCCSPGQATAASSVMGEIAGVFDSNTTYIDTTKSVPVAISRPSMSITADKTTITANGTDTATFTGGPAGVSVSIDGNPTQLVTGASLTFSATDTGTYALTFSIFPYIDQTINVVAS